MIPLLVFLMATAMLGFAVVETAFGLMMRRPQRLEAERAGARDALSAYLEDPLKFFIPARLARGILLIVVMVLLAQAYGNTTEGVALTLVTGLAIFLAVGHLLPVLFVRRSPERVLDLLLPPFSAIANVLAPLTTLLILWVGVASPRDPDEATRSGDASAEPSEAQQPQADESRLLRSVVDFGETLVREVMTPRPDIVAIRADASIDELRQLVREQEYSRLPVFTENLDNIVGLIVVKDLLDDRDADRQPQGVEIMRPAAFVPRQAGGRSVQGFSETVPARWSSTIRRHGRPRDGGGCGRAGRRIRDDRRRSRARGGASHRTFVFSAKVAIGDRGSDRPGN